MLHLSTLSSEGNPPKKPYTQQAKFVQTIFGMFCEFSHVKCFVTAVVLASYLGGVVFGVHFPSLTLPIQRRGSKPALARTVL